MIMYTYLLCSQAEDEANVGVKFENVSKNNKAFFNKTLMVFTPNWRHYSNHFLSTFTRPTKNLKSSKASKIEAFLLSRLE